MHRIPLLDLPIIDLATAFSAKSREISLIEYGQGCRRGARQFWLLFCPGNTSHSTQNVATHYSYHSDTAVTYRECGHTWGFAGLLHSLCYLLLCFGARHACRPRLLYAQLDCFNWNFITDSDRVATQHCAQFSMMQCCQFAECDLSQSLWICQFITECHTQFWKCLR